MDEYSRKASNSFYEVLLIRHMFVKVVDNVA